MKNQCKYPNYLLLETFSSLLAILALNLISVFIPSSAKPVMKAELPEEREIHNTFSRGQSNGALIDATNPMDLINRLRQATAMDDATNPSDAIDDALRAFDENELNIPPTKQISPAIN